MGLRSIQLTRAFFLGVAVFLGGPLTPLVMADKVSPYIIQPWGPVRPAHLCEAFLMRSLTLRGYGGAETQRTEDAIWSLRRFASRELGGRGAKGSLLRVAASGSSGRLKKSLVRRRVAGIDFHFRANTIDYLSGFEITGASSIERFLRSVRSRAVTNRQYGEPSDWRDYVQWGIGAMIMQGAVGMVIDPSRLQNFSPGETAVLVALSFFWFRQDEVLRRLLNFAAGQYSRLGEMEARNARGAAGNWMYLGFKYRTWQHVVASLWANGKTSDREMAQQNYLDLIPLKFDLARYALGGAALRKSWTAVDLLLYEGRRDGDEEEDERLEPKLLVFMRSDAAKPRFPAPEPEFELEGDRVREPQVLPTPNEG